MPSVPSYMQPGAKFPGALQVIREQLPRFFEEPHTEAMRNVADVLIPQTPSDILLEAAFSPIGKAKRLASLAGAAATYSPESEAGVGGLRSLLKMLIGDRFYEDKPVDLDGLLWQFGNPGISVLDPNIMNIDSIARKKGGLVQCSCGGAK